MYLITFWVPVFIIVGIIYHKYQHKSVLLYNTRGRAGEVGQVRKRGLSITLLFFLHVSLYR